MSASSTPRRWPRAALALVVPLLLTIITVGVLPTDSRPVTLLAAIVDLDEPVTLGTENIAVGRGVTQALLTQKDDIQWSQASASDAAAGVDAGRYSAVVVIPREFSRSVAIPGAPRSTIRVSTAPNTPVPQSVVTPTVAQATRAAVVASVAQAQMQQVQVQTGSGSSALGEAATGAQTVDASAQQLGRTAEQTQRAAQEAQTRINQAKVDATAMVGTMGGSSGASEGAQAAASLGEGVAGGVSEVATASRAHAATVSQLQAATGRSSAAVAEVETQVTEATAKAQAVETLATTAQTQAGAAAGSTQTYVQQVNAAALGQRGLEAEMVVVQQQLTGLSGELEGAATDLKAALVQTEDGASPTEMRTLAALLRQTADDIEKHGKDTPGAVLLAREVEADAGELARAATLLRRDLVAATRDQVECPAEFASPESCAAWKAGRVAGLQEAITLIDQSGVVTQALALETSTKALTKIVSETDNARGLLLRQLRASADGLEKMAGGMVKGAAASSGAVDEAFEGVGKAVAEVGTASGAVVQSAATQSAALTALDVDSPAAQGVVAQSQTVAQTLTAQQAEIGALSTSMGSLGGALTTLDQAVTEVATGAGEAAGQSNDIAQKSETLAPKAQQAGKAAKSAATESEKKGETDAKTKAQAEKVAKGVDDASSGVGEVVSGTGKLGEQAGTVAGQASALSTQVGKAAADEPDVVHVAPIDELAVIDVGKGAEPGADFSWTVLQAVLLLWVAALLVMELFPPLGPGTKLSSASGTRLIGGELMPRIAMAVVQAVVISAISALVVRDAQWNWWMVGLGLAIAGAVFAAVNHALAAWFGKAGRWISAMMLVCTALSALSGVATGWVPMIGAWSAVTPALEMVKGLSMGVTPTWTTVAVLATWGGAGVIFGGLAAARARTSPPPARHASTD